MCMLYACVPAIVVSESRKMTRNTTWINNNNSRFRSVSRPRQMANDIPRRIFAICKLANASAICEQVYSTAVVFFSLLLHAGRSLAVEPRLFSVSGKLFAPVPASHISTCDWLYVACRQLGGRQI